MKLKVDFRAIGTILVIFFAIYLIVGCAAKNPFWGDAKSGYIIMYRGVALWIQ